MKSRSYALRQSLPIPVRKPKSHQPVLPRVDPAPETKIPAGIEISTLTKHIGENVCVRGWLTGKRSSGSMLFLQLRDGSGFLQGVLERSLVGENCWAAAQKLTNESSCFVWGTVKST